MDLAVLGLTVDATGAIVALERFSGAADRASRAGSMTERMAHRLRQAFVAMGMAMGVRGMIEYSDSWMSIHARINLAVHSTERATVVQKMLYESAQNTRVPLESIATLYTRVARNADQLGRSHRELITFTDLVSKSLVIGGSTVQEATQSTIQLSQALASGKLQGDEFRTVMESMPGVARAIAQGLGVPTAALYKLRSEGKITSDVIIRSVLNMQQQIESEFKEMPVTIGQSFTVLRNAMMRFVGEGATATGIGRAFAQSVIFLSHHLRELVQVVAVLLALQFARWIGGMVEGARAGFAAMMALRQAHVATTAAAFQGAQANLAAARSQEANTRATLQAAQARHAAVLAAQQQVAATLASSQSTVANQALQQASVTLSRQEAAARVAVTTAQIAATEATVVGTTAQRAATVASVAHTAALRGMAVTSGLVTAAARAMWLAIGGPVGLVVLGLTALAYAFWRVGDKARQAKQEVDEFRGSLASMNKQERLIAEAEIDTQIWEIERELARMRRAGWNTEIDYGIQQALQARLEQLREKQAILERFAEDNAWLDAPVGNLPPPTTEVMRGREKAILDFRNDLKLLVLTAEQEIDVSRRQGMAAQQLSIHYESLAHLARLRADLAEKVVAKTITQSDADHLGAEAARAVARAETARVEAMRQSSLVSAQNRGEDRIRELQQEIQLAVTYGRAQEELRVHFNAANAAIEARRMLTGEALNTTLQSIQVEEQLSLKLLSLQGIAGQIGKAFSDTFKDILMQGIRTFGDLFDRIKTMFLDMVVEMQLNRLVPLLTARVNQILNSVLGQTTTQQPTGVSASAGLRAWAMSLERTEVGGAAVGGTNLAPLVATATSGAARNRELLKQFGNYLGAAMAAASIGQMFGYASGSGAVGALGGGLSGAAAGFAMAGPVGGIIGGVAGLASGILGAHKKQQEAERLRLEVVNKNTARLEALRESIDGSPLLSGKNLAGLGSLASALGGIGSISGAGGLSAAIQSVVSASGLAKALRGGESSAELKALEKQYGVSLQQLGRAAQALGIELFDANGKLVRPALEQLAEALRLTIEAATKFGNNLDDIRRRQDARNQLFDLDTPEQRLSDTYEVLSKLAPELMKQMGLANLNLDSEAGRNVLLEGLREIFKLVDGGLLTPELLGSFTDKNQLIDAILAAKKGLDEFRNSLGNVTTDFPKAMDLILFEQRRGKGVDAGSLPKTTSSTTSASMTGPVVAIQKIEVNNYGGEPIVGERLVDEMERAVIARGAKGGVIRIGSVIVQ